MNENHSSNYQIFRGFVQTPCTSNFWHHNKRLRKVYSFDQARFREFIHVGKSDRRYLRYKNERELKRMRKIVEQINALEPTISALSDADLSAKLQNSNNVIIMAKV